MDLHVTIIKEKVYDHKVIHAHVIAFLQVYEIR